ISNNKNVDIYNSMLQSYLAKSTNTKHKEYVSNLVGALISLKPGNPLPNVKVFDVLNNELDLSSVLKNKPCVIFFWSQATMNHVVESHRKVRSEEHTSELQSREKLVCRLLLEKKKRQ